MKRKALALAAIAAVLAGAWLTGHLSTLFALATSVPIVFGMIVDTRTQFASAVSVVNAVGLTLVGDVIDTSVIRNISSPPDPLYLVIQVQTTILAAAGAASVGFILASDAQAAIAVDGSATEHARTMQIPKATLVAGYTFVLPLPGEQPLYERYLGIIENVATNPVTTGKINAFLTHDPKQYKAMTSA